MTSPSSRFNLFLVFLVILAGCLHYALPHHGLVGNTLLFIAVLLHSYTIWCIKRTVIYFIVAAILGYVAEFIGINTSWIFGTYHYNATDASLLYGVPLFIPMMYCYLLYSGHFLLLAISKQLLQKRNLLTFAILTGFLMALKDFGTDPLHSTIAQVWIWQNGGAYLGVPIHNFLGWFGVFCVMTLATVSLGWHCKNYSEPVTLNTSVFYVPLLVFLMITVFGITAAFSVPSQDQSIGSVSAFVTVFTLVPYLVLAWVNRKN